MKKIFFVLLITILSSSYSNAEITTKKQADDFINQYCISLVNEFEKALEFNNAIMKEDELEGEDEFSGLLLAGVLTGAEINRIIEVYIKLCK